MEYLVAWSSATRETHGDEQSRRGVANYAAAARYAAAPETTLSHGSPARWSAGDARRDAADLWSSVQSSRSTGVTCCQEQSSGGLPNLGVVCVKHARRQRRRGRRQRVDSRRAEAHQEGPTIVESALGATAACCFGFFTRGGAAVGAALGWLVAAGPVVTL